jgi:hypothetical protein
LPASFNAETTRVHVTATYLSAIDTTSHGGSANLDLVANQSAKTNIILLKPTTSTLNRALPVFSSHLRGVFSKAGMGTSGSDLNEDQTLAGVRMLATWDSTATVNKRIASGARWALSGALGLMPNRDATETEAWADTSEWIRQDAVAVRVGVDFGAGRRRHARVGHDDTHAGVAVRPLG